MLRSLTEGRGEGWAQRRGLLGGVTKGGHMSCLVPLPACALVECRVTWKRPPLSHCLALRFGSYVCLKRATVPSTPFLTHTTCQQTNPQLQKTVHKMQVKTQRCDRKHTGQLSEADVSSSHSERGLGFPKTGRVSEDQTNTQSHYPSAA